MKKLTYICPHCQSSNVTMDAAVYWNVEDQVWDTSGDRDGPVVCCDCGFEDYELSAFEKEHAA